MRASRLLIHVQDLEFNPVYNAKLEIVIGKDRPRRVPFATSLGRYVLGGLQPGATCRLRVTGVRGVQAEERILEIQAGDNWVFFIVAPKGTPYYMASGERIYFRRDNRRLMLVVTGAECAKKATALLQRAGARSIEVVKSETLASSDEAQILVVTPGNATERARLAARIYEQVSHEFPKVGLNCRIALPMLRGKNTIEGLTNELVVRFASSVTEEHVARIVSAVGFAIMRRVAYISNGWLIQRPGVPGYDLLDIAIELMHRYPVVYAEPNVLVRITPDVYNPNDFLYPEQPHYGVINADDAWDTLDNIAVNLRAGSSAVTVAVFDIHGVDPTHPDLTGNLTDGTAKVIANWNFVAMANQTAAALGGDHGTQCASSAVGGFDNGTGATGLAGNCHLIGARTPTVLSGIDIADAWIWAAGFNTGNTNAAFPALPAPAADVVSNSWGVTNGPLTAAVKDAFDFLTTFGRNGRGCVVCFSTGNLGYVQFSSIRRYAAYQRTIAVGASINANPTNPCTSSQPDPAGNTANLPALVDTRSYFNPYGPEMDIVAPTHTSYAAGAGALVDPIVAAVRVGQGAWTGRATTATTLTAAVAAGAISIPVASTAGFAVGGIALIGIPGAAAREFVQVNGIAGNQLSVPALQNGYPSGTQVSTGPRDYDRSFGGTSHACPTVAGAAALVLSVRQELTWIQVRELLRSTAARIDGTQANAIGQWVDNDGDGVNEFSQWYGYGRLDVNAAVTAASTLGAVADVVIRENLADTGAVPSTGPLPHSPDIWVRRLNDPVPALAYASLPPHENPLRGQDNYVFLRARNVGTAATNEVYLRALITHYPGFEFRYPDDWIPSTRPGDALPTPLVPGTYLIGEVLIDNLAPGIDTIVKMKWDQAGVPPNTVLVNGINVTWHPCILAEVSPHDGPAPTGLASFPVQRDNNLAQRNIRVEDPADTDDMAYGVVAGTMHPAGVDAVIIDRSELPADYRAFVRVADPRHWAHWLELLGKRDFEAASPLPPSAGSAAVPQNLQLHDWPIEGHGCRVTLLDATRLAVDCGEGTLVVHAPMNTRLEYHCPPERTRARPTFVRDQYMGQEVLTFTGGALAAALPLRLASAQFIPLVLGIKRPQGRRRAGLLKATQRRPDGELSPGYVIEV